MRRFLALLLPLFLALPCAAQTVKFEGSSFETSFYLVGHKVKLNGLGVGQLDNSKGYVAALYLVKTSRSLPEAIASPGPKRLELRMLREVESQELGRQLSITLSSNVPRSELSGCLPGLAQIGEAFGAKKRLAAGDQFSMDSVMGQGTHILINGERVALVKGPEFFGCLLKAYLGDQPSNAALKRGLLSPPAV
ncbi:MAG: chalcone isomerase family protein [Inhella sp.]